MTSSETSSFEFVDVVKEDGPKFHGERSYYPSQTPEDSTDRVDPSAREQLSNSSQRPTECTSGVITGEVTIDAPKVGELADNLMVATRENERLRTAMEGCNEVLKKHVEATESKQQEMENLKATLGDYKMKIAELESINKSLQDQLLTLEKFEQGMSQLTGETDHSVHDAAASLREQLAESNTEKEELRMMNNNLQQSKSSLQYEIDCLKQENQKLVEEKKAQSDCFNSNEQLKSHISQLQEEMERLSLSKNDASEAQLENRKLKFVIKSKDEEIARLQKQSFQQTQSEFQTLPSGNNVAERAKLNTRLMNKLEETNNEKNKLQKELSDLKAEMAAHQQSKEDLYKQEKTKIQELQEELEKEKRKHEETQSKVRHYSNSSEDLEAKRKTLEKKHTQLTEDHVGITEALKSTREMLRIKEEELSANARERDELKENLETVKMSNQQLNERLNATSRNLDQALDSLKYNKQQSETISSRASETQYQLQQEKESLIRQLEDGSVERDKLMEQLREAYGEKEKIEQQFNEHVSASNETNGMLNQNITALQKHEEELKQEKESMLAHIQQMDTKLKLSDQQLNETIREYQITVQDLETTVQRKKAIEGELHKLRGHYTQVNNERNQLKRSVDEKDEEIKTLVDQQSKTVQEHSDTMELMRNQIQQYARDYEEERTARERFAQQMMKLQESVKQKDEEIDTLQGELTKYSGNRLRPAPDLNASMGGNSPYDRKNVINRSGEKRRSTASESEDQRNDQWTGNKKLPSLSSQGSEDVFNSSYPPPSTSRNHPVTMSHPPQQGDLSSSSNSRMFGPYGNVPLNATGGGGAGINSGLPPPDRSFHTDIHHLQQQSYNTPPGGGNLYRQDRNNQMNRSGEIRPSELGDHNARSEALPPPHHEQPPMTTNNFTSTSGGGDEGSTIEPCPLCGKRFPTTEELFQHAALCNY